MNGNILELLGAGAQPLGVQQVANSVDIKIGTVGGNFALQFDVPVMLLQLEPAMAIELAESMIAHAKTLLPKEDERPEVDDLADDSVDYDKP